MQQAVVQSFEVDLLEQLKVHRAVSVSYGKNVVIYSPCLEKRGIYLVQAGQVIINSFADSGQMVGLEILEAKELFGLEALFGPYATTATASKNTEVLFWDASVIQTSMRENPLLAIGLLQKACGRSMIFQGHVEAFASLSIERRVANFLIKRAGSNGSVDQDGWVALEPVTQEVISQFIGTAREIVSHYMNVFKRNGFVRYSQRGIWLRLDSLRLVLSDDTRE